MRATFDDGGTPGSVTLTLDNLNLVDSEFVSNWLFNLDPALNAANLNFSTPTKTGSFDDPSIGLGTNAYGAGPAHGFDIELGFSTSGAGGGTKRFGAGEVAVFQITGISTLTAGSFNYNNASGAGPYLTGVHVQSIDLEPDSGWLTTPEPSTMVTLALGGFFGLIRRKRRH